jgi:peroxiredoxin
VELARDFDELEARGIRLVTISYDSGAVLRALAERHGITFTMLSDPSSEVIERFDLLNPVPEWNLGEDRGTPGIQEAVATYVSVVGANANMVGIAFPGTLILDAEGRVEERYFEDFYIERNTISSVLIRRGEGSPPVEATHVGTAQLDLTTWSGNSELAAGNRFTLVLSVEPHGGMHVYAPGAEAGGYRVIALEIEPQPFIRVLPMAYPESQPYYFEPLDETVPVYEQPFTLLQGVILEGSPEAQNLLRGRGSVTIAGTLAYQACDASVCYSPVRVPLSWTMSLRPLVFR